MVFNSTANIEDFNMYGTRVCVSLCFESFESRDRQDGLHDQGSKTVEQQQYFQRLGIGRQEYLSTLRRLSSVEMITGRGFGLTNRCSNSAEAVAVQAERKQRPQQANCITVYTTLKQ